MKEYKFLITVYEGSNEWWEDLEDMKEPEKYESIKKWLAEIMDLNFVECKVENKNYYQLELPL